MLLLNGTDGVSTSTTLGFVDRTWIAPPAAPGRSV
jgi:hypothetical protein